jgi:hypothetical protein
VGCQVTGESGEAVQGSAKISACGQYRYALTRTWNSRLPSLLFIGLNPSVADAGLDDPTLRKCIRFAEGWKYGGLILANLFAFRATKPAMLRQVADPVGPENDEWLTRLRTMTEVAVAAWGHHGGLYDRAQIVTARLGKMYCLGRTKAGAPRHPLYVPSSAVLLEWPV